MSWYDAPADEVYAQFRTAVDNALREVLHSVRSTTVLRETVPYVLQLPGKRFRPLLCLLASAVEGASPWEAVPAAAALEVIHTFTLVHDDVMDRSPLRRGQPTVYKRWGEAVAILTGDVLIGLAYRLLERYAERPFYARMVSLFTQGLIEVSEGQALDLQLPAYPQPELEHYWELVDGKTVALLRTAMQLGALVGEVTPRTRALLEELAVPLGRAFQLQDDLLDLVGDTEQTGKQVGQDLREGKYTYAILRALELLPGNELLQRYRRRRGAEEASVPQLIELLQRTGILSEMEQLIIAYYERAFALLGQLPAGPARELFRELLEHLRHRRW
ncbi:All-trans-nonaprenyl-diphosphate synthase (geranyl-diphosphate specific) [bacterium HR21]|nr:All-trans-nonaprenyl-diphosphate synthase (geranyl-diphosphate specific) [bacterium HR21]